MLGSSRERQKKKKIPEYSGYINSENIDRFIDFIEKNFGNIVRIRAYLPTHEDNLIDVGDDSEGNRYALINLTRKNAQDGEYGGIELGVRPEKGNKDAPVIFANGVFHLNGYFIVENHPGIFHGFIPATITEVSAEQMALRG